MLDLPNEYLKQHQPQSSDASPRQMFELMEKAAVAALDGEVTGRVELITNQGGIQNRNVPPDVKKAFGKIWRATLPKIASETKRIVCHVAEKKLIGQKFIRP